MSNSQKLFNLVTFIDMLNESINEDNLHEVTVGNNRLELSRQVSNIEYSSNQNSEMFLPPNSNTLAGASHSITPSRANQPSALNKIKMIGANNNPKTQQQQALHQSSTKSIKRENTQKSLKT